MRSLILGAAVLSLIGGTGAIASIPAADGKISACYDKSTKVIRVIDSARETCKQNEQSLTWSQTGPQGPPGPSSASDVYVSRVDYVAFSQSRDIVVASVTVPAGSYYVALQTLYVSTSQPIGCRFGPDGSYYPVIGQQRPLMMMDVRTFSTETTVDFECRDGAPSEPFVGSILTAMRVGTVH